jgi:hypothetical protein
VDRRDLGQALQDGDVAADAHRRALDQGRHTSLMGRLQIWCHRLSHDLRLGLGIVRDQWPSQVGEEMLVGQYQTHVLDVTRSPASLDVSGHTLSFPDRGGARGPLIVHSPAMAPAVMPSVKRRWKSKKMIKSGITLIVASAIQLW